MTENIKDPIIVGKVSGVFGVKGWVKIFSHTRKKEYILKYSQWFLGCDGSWEKKKVIAGQPHGKTVIVQFEHSCDRDAAAAFIGKEIAVSKSSLPKTETDEYYWFDLQGLKVTTVGGVSLGVVDTILETGANDVLVVKGDRERLIPFVQGEVITNIDVAGGEMLVDWDPEF